MTVVSSANLWSFTDGSFVGVEGEEQRGNNTPLGGASAGGTDVGEDASQPRLLFPVSGRWGSCKSTDRWRLAGWAGRVYLSGFPGWWCWKASWSPQTGSVRTSLWSRGVGGRSAVPCWLHHAPPCLPSKKTVRGPTGVLWCPLGDSASVVVFGNTQYMMCCCILLSQ